MFKKMMKKIISAGNIHRKSRLHDDKGHFAGWSNIIRHTPIAIFTGFLRIIFGIRPEQPWIAYSAIRVFKQSLKKNSRVLEYGSGMSTIWFSKYASEVCSVENNREWYEIISNRLKNKNIQNVKYQLQENRKKYINFANHDKKGFDLIVIDGEDRDKCAEISNKLIKPGGIIYLDNSDTAYAKKAEKLLLTFAKAHKATVKYFVDFAPTQFFVQEGLMIIMPN